MRVAFERGRPKPHSEAFEKNFFKKIKKGIDKRGVMWYNSQAVLERAARDH